MQLQRDPIHWKKCMLDHELYRLHGQSTILRKCHNWKYYTISPTNASSPTIPEHHMSKCRQSHKVCYSQRRIPSPFPSRGAERLVSWKHQTTTLLVTQLTTASLDIRVHRLITCSHCCCLQSLWQNIGNSLRYCTDYNLIPKTCNTDEPQNSTMAGTSLIIHLQDLKENISQLQNASPLTHCVI